MPNESINTYNPLQTEVMACQKTYSGLGRFYCLLETGTYIIIINDDIGKIETVMQLLLDTSDYKGWKITFSLACANNFLPQPHHIPSQKDCCCLYIPLPYLPPVAAAVFSTRLQHLNLCAQWIIRIHLQNDPLRQSIPLQDKESHG